VASVEQQIVASVEQQIVASVEQQIVASVEQQIVASVEQQIVASVEQQIVASVEQQIVTYASAAMSEGPEGFDENGLQGQKQCTPHANQHGPAKWPWNIKITHGYSGHVHYCSRY